MYCQFILCTENNCHINILQMFIKSIVCLYVKVKIYFNKTITLTITVEYEIPTILN